MSNLAKIRADGTELQSWRQRQRQPNVQGRERRFLHEIVAEQRQEQQHRGGERQQQRGHRRRDRRKLTTVISFHFKNAKPIGHRALAHL